MPKVAVLGAGLSGLICARLLQEHGMACVVLEKSRSLGGRCATRSWNGHVIDHGAQYFTATQELFQSFLNTHPEGDICALSAKVVNTRGQTLRAKGGNRYYHLGGNNKIGLHLAQGLKVLTEKTVEAVAPAGSKWKVLGESYDAVVLTPPWPQTAALIDKDPGLADYVPCLTVLFEYEGDWAGASQKQYAIKDMTGMEDLTWSACENHKRDRIQPGRTVFVVQASSSFSHTHLEAMPEAYIPLLQKPLQERWDLQNSQLLSTFSHRWRYARAISPTPPLAALEPGLFLCGDSVVQSRLEDVFVSGAETAGNILKYLA